MFQVNFATYLDIKSKNIASHQLEFLANLLVCSNYLIHKRHVLGHCSHCYYFKCYHYSTLFYAGLTCTWIWVPLNSESSKLSTASFAPFSPTMCWKIYIQIIKTHVFFCCKWPPCENSCWQENKNTVYWCWKVLIPRVETGGKAWILIEPAVVSLEKKGLGVK